MNSPIQEPDGFAQFSVEAQPEMAEETAASQSIFPSFPVPNTIPALWDVSELLFTGNF